MLSSIAGILLSLTTLISGITGTLNNLLGASAYEQVAQVVTSQQPILTTIPKVARLNYHGFYFVEDDAYGFHYLSELSGSNNTVLLDFDHIQGNPQVLADNIRKNKYIGVEIHFVIYDSTLTNTNGARNQYLANMKKVLFQDSDLGKMVISFHVMEEEFTLQRQGFFDSWPTFSDPNFLLNCQAKYGDRTLNFTNCKDLYLKMYLESFIDDVHKTFPGIPVVIVENSWGYSWNPPSNLDVLGLDAYYIPTSSACDATQKAKFDSEVTNLLNTAKKFGKPIQLVGPLFYDGNYKMLSQCQAQWYLDLAKATPEVTSFNWFAYGDVQPVMMGIRNYSGAPLSFIKSEGAKIVAEAEKPVITSATISPKLVVANGASTYDITVTTNDVDGLDDIKVQYALINQLYQGPNSGQFRGYLGWSRDGDSVQKYYFPGISGSAISCIGGGTAGKGIGYGEVYINLLSCTTSTTTTSRTTTFTVSFNGTFTGPTNNNTVSGWSADGALNRSSWVTTEAGFSLGPNNAPKITSAIINPKPIAPGSGTPYSVVVTTSDADGVSDIKVQYASINVYQGPNTGQSRGYIGWSKDGDSVQKYYFPGISGNAIACTGGGTAAKAVGYGETYMNLLSCSTTTSGNSRTTTFVVTFDGSFTTPTTNNTLSAWSADNSLARSTWITYETFNISNTKPTIADASISPLPLVADGKTTSTISVTTTDPDTWNDIKVQYALINQLYQGTNGGQYRGYLGWSKDGDSVQTYYFPGINGSSVPCTGGGMAAKAVGYGDTYINLLGCSTTVLGNSRTTNFTVTFNPTYTTPTAGNTISGWSADSALNRSSWVTTALPFSLK